ncbi:MAG: lipid-A-disaccharide synthase, partial [Nostoc sp.]
AAGVSQKYAHKFTVVGDLMVEASSHSFLAKDKGQMTELIGILPGSKAAKLAQGVPLCLAIAEYIHAKKPQTKFVIPVAPTLDLQTLASFADPQKNSIAEIFGFDGASLI